MASTSYVRCSTNIEHTSGILLLVNRRPHHPRVDQLDLVAVLSALAHPVRLRIVEAVAAKGERAWGEFDVPVAKSTLSHHLKLLRDAGVIQTRQEGTRCFVSLRHDDIEHRFPGLLDAVVPEARPPNRR
jgi:DNA-binding transcriptional ArsR family regulator